MLCFPLIGKAPGEGNNNRNIRLGHCHTWRGVFDVCNHPQKVFYDGLSENSKTGGPNKEFFSMDKLDIQRIGSETFAAEANFDFFFF